MIAGHQAQQRYVIAPIGLGLVDGNGTFPLKQSGHVALPHRLCGLRSVHQHPGSVHTAAQAGSRQHNSNGNGQFAFFHVRFSFRQTGSAFPARRPADGLPVQPVGRKCVAHQIRFFHDSAPSF